MLFIAGYGARRQNEGGVEDFGSERLNTTCRQRNGIFNKSRYNYMRQENAAQTIISLTSKMKYLLIGAGIKIENGAIVTGGFENKFLRIMYSNAVVIDRIAEMNSHEVSLAVQILKLRLKDKWMLLHLIVF